MPVILFLAGLGALVFSVRSAWQVWGIRRASAVQVTDTPLAARNAAVLPASAEVIPTATPVATESLAFPPVPTATPTPSAAVYMIDGVPIGKQVRHLNCEFQSAADLAAFYGVNVSWKDVFLKVGVDPNGDPSVGFVGISIDDEPGHVYPRGYGVYALPVARGLRTLGLNAHAYYGANVSWLKTKITNGQPVIVWTTYDMHREEVVYWKTADGKKTIKGVPWEHTYTAVGFDINGIYLNDPVTAKRWHFGWEDFERSWDYLDDMALTIEPPFVLRETQKGG